MKTKSIKDNVHGYIAMEEPFWRIIDTAQFQRLKWLEQTSYRVLYPSARHDRFIHSIGTHFLGQRAFDGFLKNCQSLLETYDVAPLRSTFLFACLLHDIGHAPFSHTCEDLYNYHGKISNPETRLNKELFACIKKYFAPQDASYFIDDYKKMLNKQGLKVPSEHEIMSAIITMQNYEIFVKGFIDNGLEKPLLDLTVRAILGFVYPIKRQWGEMEKTEKGIKNCLIRLLNSSTVDVDKLDYIARDTMMTGYETVVLDNDRLFSSLSFVRDNDVYYPAFNKSALSVINNVIAAKNAQARWIVNHPIVLYEFYLLRKAIGVSLREMHNNGNQYDGEAIDFDEFLRMVFSSKSLSETIHEFGDLKLVLLSDVDILSIMKQYIFEPDVSEFFKRNERKSPVWKSHEEYRHCLGGADAAEKVADFFKPLLTYMIEIEDIYHPQKINQKLYEGIESENEEITKILEVLRSYCLDNNYEFEFVALPAKNKFATEINGKQTYIRFGIDDDDYSTYDMLQGSAPLKDEKNYEFFYLYSKSKLNTKDFLKEIHTKVVAIEDVRC